MRLLTLCCAAIVLTTPLPASAAFHLMNVVEVFPGTPASPSAQYVVLQMWAGGQNLVAGHAIQVYDAANALVGTATFGGNVANGANQSKILIATTQASTFFGVTADLTLPAPAIAASGGKICFDAIDCVAWGNYGGPSTGVGTPFQAGSGIDPGRAIARRLNISGGATTLDAADDTGNSNNDFVTALPAPRNNANQSGIIPPSTCGNGTIEGLELCDDNNTTGGDGCSATCVPDTATVGVEDPSAAGLRSVHAAPNPFRGGNLSVRFQLARGDDTELGIYDLTGRQVRRLHRAFLPAGAHVLAWDGLDDAGRATAAGVYTIRLRSNGQVQRARLVRLH